MLNKKIQIENPVENYPTSVKKQKDSAAGWPAVWTALLHVFRTSPLMSGVASLLKLNHKTGFDCPGCAWPDPDGNRHIAEFCENGAKAVAEETTSKRATPEVFSSWSVAKLSALNDFQLGQLGRFTEPMILRKDAGHYERLSWDHAFEIIGDEIAKASPNESVFYTSGKASNEAAFLFQLYSRVLGTNNLPDCSNMCHESSGLALSSTIGSGKGSIKLDDFNHADVILLIGQNPGTNHPRMLSALQAAVRNGCKIISINPMREAGLTGFMNPQEISGMLGISTELSSLHIPVRINGDVAIFKGILKLMFEAEAKNPGKVFDHDFIKKYTNGFDQLKADSERVDWSQVQSESGVSRELIEKAAGLIIHSKRMISCWAMGLTQHKNAVANIEEVVNIHLLRGQMGRRGAGLCPVRGHSNVQGDRTMGIWEQMNEDFLAKLDTEFQFKSPREHGYDAVAAIEAMQAGRVKNFVSLGGNFMSATPDTAYVAKAMRKVNLYVHISTKPHRGHLVTGQTAIILPCLGRTERDVQKAGEQFVTTENSMGVIEMSRGQAVPASKFLMSEPAIIARMAEATFRNHEKKRNLVNWRELSDDYDLLRNRIEKVVPGFTNFNERIKKNQFFYLPHAVRDELKFKTKSGKAEFKVNPIPPSLLKKPDQFLLMTIRSHDQFNTTIYGEDDRYRGILGGRRIIFMNPEDVAAFGYKSGQQVDITSHFEGEERHVQKFQVVPYEIPRRCVACYFPEANPLAQIKNFADGSRQPVYKSLVVTLQASAKTGAQITATAAP